MLARANTFGYADPRRLHSEGRQARSLLDNARAALAQGLGVLTSSGTAAVHLGLLGLMEYADGLVAGSADHSAVLETGRWLAARGKSFRTAPVDRLGRCDPAGWRADSDEVVAWQAANHEVGTLQQPPTHAGPVFLDARASAGRLALPQNWDAAALSAHMWGGPPGVGVLLVRAGARWRNPWPSDDRADPRSPGFENIPAALAAGAALQALALERTELNTRQHRLIERLRQRVSQLPDVDLHGDPYERLPHLLAFSCLFVNGEALVSELDRRGFAVASGSACTASALEPSHVLVAMGALTHGNLRVSLTRETTEADIDRFAQALAESLVALRAEL